MVYEVQDLVGVGHQVGAAADVGVPPVHLPQRDVDARLLTRSIDVDVG